MPFDVSIETEYDIKDNIVIVTYWMEDENPYDNPSEKWFYRMKEIIEDYFYEENKDYKVIYKT